jgi:hypothetical protein
MSVGPQSLSLLSGVGLTDQPRQWRPGGVQRDPTVSYLDPCLRIGGCGGRQRLHEARLEMLDRLEARAELRMNRWPGNGCRFPELMASPSKPDVDV